MKQIVALVGFFCLFLGTASAQYLGPKEGKVRSENVSWVIDHARFLEEQDAQVYLTGFIVRQISKEKFLFRDESGSIRIEIEEKNMPAEPFDDRTEVIILGEVESEFMESPEIDVTEITIIID